MVAEEIADVGKQYDLFNLAQGMTKGKLGAEVQQHRLIILLNQMNVALGGIIQMNVALGGIIVLTVPKPLDPIGDPDRTVSTVLVDPPVIDRVGCRAYCSLCGLICNRRLTTRTLEPHQRGVVTLFPP